MFSYSGGGDGNSKNNNIAMAMEVAVVVRACICAWNSRRKSFTDSEMKLMWWLLKHWFQANQIFTGWKFFHWLLYLHIFCTSSVLVCHCPPSVSARLLSRLCNGNERYGCNIIYSCLPWPQKPQLEHLSVYLITEANKLFNILSLAAAAAAAPIFLIPSMQCMCAWVALNFSMKTRIINFFDFISWITRKIMWIAPAKVVEFFAKAAVINSIQNTIILFIYLWARRMADRWCDQSVLFFFFPI